MHTNVLKKFIQIFEMKQKDDYAIVNLIEQCLASLAPGDTTVSDLPVIIN